MAMQAETCSVEQRQLNVRLSTTCGSGHFNNRHSIFASIEQGSILRRRVLLTFVLVLLCPDVYHLGLAVNREIFPPTRKKPIAVAARSKARTVFARSNTAIVGSNPT
jgi:hypothetical protein